MARCKWCNTQNPLYVKYHDEEWGSLRTDDRYLFEMLILEGFQAGLSWECILNKREAFREAFDDFNIDLICNYSEEKLLKLYENKNIVRNKLKINSTVINAKVFKEIVREFGCFYNYLCSFTKGEIFREFDKISSPLSDAVSADLKARGMKFCGTVIIYSYLQAVGIINSHEENCFLYGNANKKTVTEYFNKKAPVWDSIAIDCSDKIRRILHIAEVNKDASVVDIACGTGILIPFLKESGCKKILSVDISPEMIRIAKEKYKEIPNTEFICADAENFKFPRKYDRAILFDALPHFENPITLFSNIADALKKDGRFTIAHSMGKAQLDDLHKNSAPGVSRKLIPATELKELMEAFFNVDTTVSEKDIYIVSGTKR